MAEKAEKQEKEKEGSKSHLHSSSEKAELKKEGATDRKKVAEPPSSGNAPSVRGEKPESKPKHEKERVKQLIEEKMEKIRQQELAKGENKAEGVPEPEEKAEQKKQPKAPKESKETEGGKAAFKPKSKPLPTSAFVTGKRKRAVARAHFKPGKGVIKVNSIPIELSQPDMFRLKMMEPLMVIGDEWKKFDADINVRGGGPSGQADAVRQAIARALSELLGSEARKTFLSYDRNLIVYDSRRTEPHKPPRSSQGPRRYKQRSKR